MQHGTSPVPSEGTSDGRETVTADYLRPPNKLSTRPSRYRIGCFWERRVHTSGLYQRKEKAP